LPAVAIVVVAWLAFWMATGFPIACNLVSVCPDREVRMFPALLFAGLMLVPLASALIASRVRVAWLVRASLMALVALAVVGYAVICLSAGFGVDPPLLIGLLAVCGTAGIARVGISTPRRSRT
jgi:hypothetical protein